MFCFELTEETTVEDAGGKAWNLARARGFGARTPRTAVLGRAALGRFLEATPLGERVTSYLESFPTLDGAAARAAHARLVETAAELPVPPEVLAELEPVLAAMLAEAPYGLALRSSALYEDAPEASFAGVFESFLGATTVLEAIDRVRAVWASSWAPRAVRYLRRMELEPRADAMAVMIQPVLPARASGVLYTADPETGDPRTFVLRATRGLSVDLMSGSGEGDELRLDWDTGEVTARDVARKRILWEAAGGSVRQVPTDDERPAVTDREAAELASVARGLDEAFGMRLDVELVLLEEGPTVVQARPLTACPDFFPVEEGTLDPEKTWVPAMFTLPLWPPEAPHRITPLYRDLSAGEHWHRYQPEDIVLVGVWREEHVVNGYLFVEAPPWPNWKESFESPAEYEAWLDANEPAYRTRWDRRHEELAEQAEAARRALAETSTAAELVPAMLAARDRCWDMSAFGWSAPQSLGWMCEELFTHFLSEAAPELEVGPVVGGGLASHTFLVTRALQELGRGIHEPVVARAFDELGSGEILPHLLEQAPDCEFLRDFDAVSWHFGRTPLSWMGRSAFWNLGDRAADVATIRRARSGASRDVGEMRSTSLAEREQHEERAREVLAEKDPALVPRFEKMLGWVRYWSQALNDRHGLGPALLWERELVWEVGRRLAAEGMLDEPEDVLLLHPEDLRRLDELPEAGERRALFLARRREYRRVARLTPPASLGASPGGPGPGADAATTPETDRADGRVLRGTGFAGGRVRGTARRVEDIGDPALLDSLTDEDLLVLPHPEAFAYADWHSLLTLIGGVVSPGRPAHHLTQVARECGVPVVGHVTGDLTRIADGDRLEIDAGAGTVRLLDQTDPYST